MSDNSLPETMRVVQLTGYGDLDRLQLLKVPRPDPAAGEVLIRVGACGLNNTDLNLRKGWYGDEDDPDAQSGWKADKNQFPRIQGADIVGEVVAVGGDITAEKVGERVIVNPTIYNTDPDNPIDIDFIGSERDGGFAEYASVPAANAHKITSTLSDAELATFPTAYLTAWHMLERAAIRTGETVLVTGATGGVGSALVQIAQARGASVIAIAGRGKEQHLHELGVAHVIPRNVGDLAGALANLRFHVVADVVGGAAISQFLSLIEPGGRIVTAGAIAGPHVEIDLRTLYLRHISLIGSTLGTASDFAALVNAIEQGVIRPLLAMTFPLEQLQDAQTAFEEKGYFGKIVIIP